MSVVRREKEYVKALPILLAFVAAPLAAQHAEYRVLVVSEATDVVTQIRFAGDSGVIERAGSIGLNPVEPDGPHGVAMAPDGQHYYVTTGHGLPFGDLWKFTADGRAVARVTLGMFPASLQVSPDGRWVYVANFNLHGEMVPSSVSIVAADEMVEVARPETCTMPHGSRFNAAGTRHYSTCMMDDLLVEIDATKLEVSRKLGLNTANGEQRTAAGANSQPSTDHAAHATTGARCSPTWAVPTPNGRSVFVACNATNEIVEVDTDAWKVTRRIPAGPGVYNLGISHDGTRLIGTNKKGQSVSVFDVASGRELARIATLRRAVHGVAVSGDDRYAFISVEGYGAEPGTVEMIDLAALKRVASVDVGQMAAGIETYPAP